MDYDLNAPAVNAAAVNAPASVNNARLLAWVNQMRHLCKPKNVHWVDGTVEENDALCEQMVEAGTFIRLNPEKRPNSFLARSHPSDVARVEERTYICSTNKVDAGPTNNWAPPAEMRAHAAWSCSTAACAAAPCTSSRSAWGRSARRSPRSACRSPTVPMSSSTCGS